MRPFSVKALSSWDANEKVASAMKGKRWERVGANGKLEGTDNITISEQ